jgi:hypothetical protein
MYRDSLGHNLHLVILALSSSNSSGSTIIHGGPQLLFYTDVGSRRDLHIAGSIFYIDGRDFPDHWDADSTA